MPEPQTKSKIKSYLLRAAAVGFIGLCWFLGFFNRGHQAVGPILEPVAQFDHPKMEEVSGLVWGDGVLWAHNDSGNEPQLFALSVDGKVLTPKGINVEGATLKDWEAVARWENDLYVTELGNNLNASKNLGVYKIAEPTEPSKSTSVKPEGFYEITYPDQTGFPPTDRWEFDCEEAFCWDSKLYVLTKNRPAFRMFVQRDTSNLYSLNLDTLKEKNVLTRVDEVAHLGGWVTGADISSDGNWIVVLCESPVQSLWLFKRPEEGDRFFSDSPEVRRFIFQKGGQLESVAFAPVKGEEMLVMVNEEREVFHISLDRFQKVEP